MGHLVSTSCNFCTKKTVESHLHLSRLVPPRAVFLVRLHVWACVCVWIVKVWEGLHRWHDFCVHVCAWVRACRRVCASHIYKGMDSLVNVWSGLRVCSYIGCMGVSHYDTWCPIMTHFMIWVLLYNMVYVYVGQHVTYDSYFWHTFCVYVTCNWMWMVRIIDI